MNLPKQHSAVADLLDELDGDLYLLVEGDGSVHGVDGFQGLVVVGHSLAEEAGQFLDDRGHVVYDPPQADQVPEQSARVRSAISNAQQAGATFALAYHVEGDPRWRFAWSGYDRDGAV